MLLMEDWVHCAAVEESMSPVEKHIIEPVRDNVMPPAQKRWSVREKKKKKKREGESENEHENRSWSERAKPSIRHSAA